MSVGYMDCGHFLMQSINEHKPIECIYFAMGILCLNQVLKTIRIVVKNSCNILKYFLDSFIYLYLSLCKSTYVCRCSLRPERTLNPLNLKLQAEEGMGSPELELQTEEGMGSPGAGAVILRSFQPNSNSLKDKQVLSLLSQSPALRIVLMQMQINAGCGAFFKIIQA